MDPYRVSRISRHPLGEKSEPSGRGSRETELDERTYQALREADIPVLGRRLVAYALWLAANRGWAGRNSTSVLTAGISATDIVQKAFELLASGEKRWDPERGTLERFLRLVVWTEVTHLSDSAVRRRERLLPDRAEDDEVEERLAMLAGKSPPSPLVRNPTSPEENLLADEDEAELDRTIGALFREVGDDQELLDVLDAIMVGVAPKPRYLAEALGLSVSTINNRLKRLRRKAVALNRQER